LGKVGIAGKLFCEFIILKCMSAQYLFVSL